MNSHYPNVESTLMGNQQPYDDSFLKKRVKCLTSAHLLCFVVAVAALGTAIIALLKVGKEHEGLSTLFDLTFEVEALRDQVIELQMKVHESQTLKHIPSNEKPLPHESEEHDNNELQVDEELHEAENVPAIETSISNEDDPTHVEHEEDHPLTDPQDDHHVDHHDHHHSLHFPGTEDEVKEEIHFVKENQTGEAKIDDLLCDDSDLCIPVEGSGSFQLNIEDKLKGFSIDDEEDSMVDCVQFPRPACPEGAAICYTEGRCPVPICCFDDDFGI